MRIAFRFDADAQVGYGHFMRSSVLAHALADRGHELTVFTRGIPGHLAPRLAGMTHRTASTDADVLDALGRWATLGRIDWLVIDHYGIDATWEAQAAEHAGRILVIDDLANRSHACHALLDQNVPNALQRKHEGLIPANCHRWFGLDHLLARPAFYETSPAARSGLLVFLGGGNHRASLQVLLAALKPVAPEQERHVLVTHAYGPTDLHALAMLPTDTLHTDLPETAQLCRTVRGAIVRCGFIVYELALVGTPMIVIHATPIQREVALAMEHAGYAVALDEQDITEPTKLALAYARMAALTPTPLNHVCTNGAQRVAELMEAMHDQ